MWFINDPEGRFPCMIWEFKKLGEDKQKEEIAELSAIVGDISIVKESDDETNDYFRIRCFCELLVNLPPDSRYTDGFFTRNPMPQSDIMVAFEYSFGDEEQQEAIQKLSALIGDVVIQKKPDESDEDFRVRTFYELLLKPRPDSHFEEQLFPLGTPIPLAVPIPLAGPTPIAGARQIYSLPKNDDGEPAGFNDNYSTLPEATAVELPPANNPSAGTFRRIRTWFSR